MDKKAILAFCNYAIGDRIVGGRDPGDEITTPHSPELHAFVSACLGDFMPPYTHYLVPTNRGCHQDAEWQPRSKAFAALLREVADGIDPETAP